jgi:glutamyl-tRNA synthetase
MVRTRIAPSPTGFPHIGTMFQALFDYVYAKKHQGHFIVRIEDTDRERFVPEAESAIYEALNWLDLTPDESSLIGGPFGPYRQSERLEIYQQYAKELIESGHAYYCFCSADRLAQVRQEMQKAGKPPMYDKHCRHLDMNVAANKARQEPHVIRMKVPSNEKIVVHDEVREDITFDSATIDDQVIMKSDGFPTYHLAVVVDDHLMKITHLVRGEEWLSSSPKHVLLYRYFGWDMPKVIHTPLLRNPDRSKLSKRHGHAAVSWYIENGYLKEAVVNFLATRVWNHPQGKEIFAVDELISHFEFKDMHIQGPIADIDKLKWINGQWIRLLPDEELIKRLSPFLPKELSSDVFKKIWPHLKERLVTLNELPQLVSYFIHDPKVDLKTVTKESKMDPEKTADYLSKVHHLLESQSEWTIESLETSLRQLQQDLDLKPRPAFMTIRVVLTGKTATPPLFDIMEVLGKAEVLSRIQSIIKICYTNKNFQV